MFIQNRSKSWVKYFVGVNDIATFRNTYQALLIKQKTPPTETVSIGLISLSLFYFVI
jgi:hypothetical protein